MDKKVTEDIKSTIVEVLSGKATPGSLDQVDPRDFLHTVYFQRLEAHLLWRLNQIEGDSQDFSEEFKLIKTSLQRQCVFNAASNLQRDAEARELVRNMAEAGIRVMLLKGTALRARYPELSGRPQSDTDVMLKPSDLEKAEEILMEAGFRVDDKLYSRDEYLEKHFDLRFIRGSSAVELHWAMSNECREGSVARAWERAEQVDWNGVPAWLPSVEDQVVYSSIHICRHLFIRSLRWFGDLVFELERWPGIAERMVDVSADWPARMVVTPFDSGREIGLLGNSKVKVKGDAGSWNDRWFLGQIPRRLIWNEKFGVFPGEVVEYALAEWLTDDASSFARGLTRAVGLRLSGKPVVPWSY